MNRKRSRIITLHEEVEINEGEEDAIPSVAPSKRKTTAQSALVRNHAINAKDMRLAYFKAKIPTFINFIDSDVKDKKHMRYLMEAESKNALYCWAAGANYVGLPVEGEVLMLQVVHSVIDPSSKSKTTPLIFGIEERVTVDSVVYNSRFTVAKLIVSRN
jgi:hypothetical protein